ncbi:SDR family oxidoreductase [Halorhodospira halophila]|uniref:Short-chain dehydrogenase/reductase SDR n=1 Tax=Halorhodospira halophila (strain DSM 244 / SL1) TaxID=349124 RepID=A1WVI4_HALHL|nr:SDR family oxidoreductase [Halorhodospira halophila]ABM61696.1 short-chain dehydrogenase/reductase SDR [Halorhodospira halophila SL1]MBK1728973.1 cell-cell signaling protein [Halorhodospira halophila]
MALNWIPAGGEVLIQGASRGIGLNGVEQCLAQPHIGRVWASCRNPDQAEALQALAGAHPDRLRLLTLDVTDEATVRAAAAEVQAAEGRLHLVVNAAGLLHDRARRIRPEKRLEDVSPEALAALFQVNAAGPLLVARHFLPRLEHGDPAVFAAISARVGSIGDNRKGGWYAYRGSKAALNQLIRTLAVELRRRAPAVTCVSLHPGTTDTDLSAPFQAWVPAEQLFAPERTVRQLLAVIDDLAPEDSGGFFAWDGQPIPW